MRNQGISVNVIAILPQQVQWVDKIVMKKRTSVKENERFKIYLSKQYNDIRKYLHRENKKLDLLIMFI